MLAASYWSLLAPAIEIAEQLPMYGPDGRWAFVPAVVGFALGAGAIVLTEKILPLLGANTKPESWGKKNGEYCSPLSPRAPPMGTNSFINNNLNYRHRKNSGNELMLLLY